MNYVIHGVSEHYFVNNAGEIRRTRKGYETQYSGQWHVVALVQLTNFGNVTCRIPFKDWATCDWSKIQWTFKNGKPRWTLEDDDHGRRRR